MVETYDEFAKEQPYFPEAPKDLISPSDLIRQQQEILTRNGENQRKRENLHKLEQDYQKINDALSELLAKQKKIEEDLRIARLSATDLQDESTAELEDSISNIEEINRKVRANLDKEKAEDGAKGYRSQYNELTEKSMIYEVRKIVSWILQSFRFQNSLLRMVN